MRRNYVVAYDVADDKRRDRVFKTLHGFGEHVQYSVFFCELSDQELVRLRVELREAIHHLEDQVIFVDVGPVTRPLEESLEVMGKPYTPSVRSIVI